MLADVSRGVGIVLLLSGFITEVSMKVRPTELRLFNFWVSRF